MLWFVSCACVFLRFFLIVFMDFDMLLAARHGFVLSCFLLLHGLSTVAWFGSWIVGHVVAWIVMCCLMCVLDCDLLLGVCHGRSIMVSWLPCCCMQHAL